MATATEGVITRINDSYLARFYDPLLAPLELLRLRELRRRVMEAAVGLVLEVGAGTGLNLPHYRRARQVIATDPALPMLRQAFPRALQSPCPVLFVASDAQALPFPDGQFDTAVVMLAFCTIPDPKAAFTEIRRVLRANGELRLLEHVRAESPAVARVQDWLAPAWRRVAGGCHLNRDPLAIACRSGFAVRRTEYHLGGLILRATLLRR